MKEIFKLVCGSLLQENLQCPCAAEKNKKEKEQCTKKEKKKGKIILKTPSLFTRVD